MEDDVDNTNEDQDDILTSPGEEEEVQTSPSREKEYCRNRRVVKELTELYSDVEAGYDDANQRVNDTLDYWDIYNCKLGPNQFYKGTSAIFVPLVTDAIEARVTRFLNQIFPTSKRHVEVTSSEDQSPRAITALLEDYIRKSKLRTVVMPALLRSGDIEGHYHVYVSWETEERHVAWRVKEPVQLIDNPDLEDPDEEIDNIEEQEIETGHPTVEVIADEDVLVLPTTSDTIGEALRNGGSVTIARRWTKSMLKAKIADGSIDKKNGESVMDQFSNHEENQSDNLRTRNINAAGIQESGSEKYLRVYETYTYLTLDGERRLSRVFFAGGDKNQILSVRRNPMWSDRIPLISAPVTKVKGAFKGVSPVKKVATLQYQANDAVNEGMDTAHFSAMPIVMTDPEKNPRVGSMVLTQAAIWETSPKDTQFAEFPTLWKDQMEIVDRCAAQINKSLGTNPAQITQQASTKKLTQAEISNEQSVDLLTTANAVTTLEEGILTPLLNRFIELDHQFRDEAVTVRQYGELGVAMNMEEVPPIQWDRRYVFRWFGVEAARNAQEIQQQIGALNVIRGIPPQQYQGYRLNLAPAILQLCENVFGPRMSRQVFEDIRSQLSIDMDLENQLLAEGMDMPVHPLDDHAAHMKSHVEALQKAGGDPSGAFRIHLMQHQHAQVEQVQAQIAASQPPPGEPGVPGGNGPGTPGTPRPGAMPGQMRPAQQPPGAIHADRMRDPRMMPRRAS